MNTNEKIVVVGFGWIGQANALALKKMGYTVSYFDTSETPNLHYTNDDTNPYEGVSRISRVDEVDSDETWYIVCVGDRVSEEREQDITFIKKATDSLKGLRGKVILRSTVLPQKLKELDFDMYVPEFLHEKNAVDECLNPFYFVLGFEGGHEIPSFLRTWERRSHKVFKGTPQEASYIKYLSNLWNTIRIAFVNEMGDSMGIPQTKEEVKRIERVLDFVFERKMYLRYGQGFDGHCLPKDTRAYIGAHTKSGKNMDLLIGAYSSNEHHKLLQERYKVLPKVFSFWEYTNIGGSFIGVLWSAFNRIGVIRWIRQRMRFFSDTVSHLIPDRTIREIGILWEGRAKKDPLYYSNMRTKSGREVTESEFRETGRKEYERYVIDDASAFSALVREGNRIILDFGCGAGRMSEYFANGKNTVHALDISPSMIEFAKKRLGDKVIIFQQYTGITLPYEDDFFDAIFAFQVFQHIPKESDIGEYLNEFYRVLKSGGVAKVQFRGGRSPKKWEWTSGVSFTPEEAIDLVEKNGFVVLGHEVEGIKNIWLVIQKKHE